VPLNDTVHEGGCLCGQLRFAAHGPPDRVGLCHCTMCRRHTGAPFVVLAVYPSSAVSVEGETYGYRSSQDVDRRGCARCKAPVYIVAETENEVEIYTGAMDDPDPFVPQYEIFTVHRPGWLPRIGGIPGYEGFRT